MNQKNSKKKIIMVAMVAILIGTPIVYATTNQGINYKIQEKSFFYSDYQEGSVGELISMKLDLSSVSYEDFIFTLTSNTQENVILTQESRNNNIQMNRDNNVLTVTGNKKEMNFEELQFYYTIPENLSVGSIIKFTATISKDGSDTTDNNRIITNNTIEESIDNNTIDNSAITNDDEIKQETIEVIITVKEREEEKENQKEDKQEAMVSQITNNSQVKTTTLKTANTGGSGATSETVTYKGSYDNYLTDLIVEGYDISPVFSKTNHTYFLQVENEVEEISIITQKSDTNASVSIYGNTGLQIGENKVLISVIAQNGSVRIYRIYVTRED